jgi:alcohol dehydrogenase (cytochrome c)
MKRTTRALLTTSLLLAPPLLFAQQSQSGLDPAALLKPLAESWPTYSGDYSGRRFSAINQTTVKGLGLAWTARLTAGAPATPGRFGGFGRFGGGGASVIVGGEGTGEFGNAGDFGGTQVKGTVLMVNGVLYVTAPDNVWALDAQDGHLLWRYFWKTRGGTHIGNRGAGMWKSYLFFETPDDYLVSLDARTGKERWHVPLADFAQQYFSTVAPVIVGDHVLIGTGNDIDPAIRGSRRGPAWTPRGTAAARPGSRASTIPRRSSTSSAQATRRRATPARVEPATTCSRARSSRSTSTPARWPGTTRPRRTTRTTGTRRRRRC